MKNHLCKPLILWLFAFVFPLAINAHEGGHFRNGDEVFLNTWQLRNGKTVKGNFSHGDEYFVYLEQQQGKILAVPLKQLAERDLALARFKIRKLETINRINEIPTPNPGHSSPFLPNPLPLVSVIIFLGLLLYVYRRYPDLMVFQRTAYRVSFASVLILASIFACKKSTETPTSTLPESIPKTSIGFLDSSFNLYKPGVTTSYDNNYYYVASGGIPSHNMMVGIRSWQQQVPIPQSYTGTNSWSIPLQPVYASTPLSTKTNLMKGAVAVAINGIPIFNALNNRGEDSYSIGELDTWGGHCGRADDYHYHAAPMHLTGTSNTAPIAFALDGFAVYGAAEPDGSNMNALDTCHGHLGKNGVYHYHGTNSYPYVVGAMRGKVNLDPATPAPENQILPQAFAKGARPATSPLKDAVITDFRSTGPNSYSLTYSIANKNGYVNYSWDASNKFTYTLIDTAGRTTTNTYQR